MQDWTSPRIGCRIGRHRWINTAYNIRVLLNNASAEIFDALIRKCGPDAFSREEAMSQIGWKEPSQIGWKGLWYALFARLFSYGKILLYPINHFLIFYLSCAGEAIFISISFLKCVVCDGD